MLEIWSLWNTRLGKAQAGIKIARRNINNLRYNKNLDREAWRAVVHGVTKSQTWLSDWTELITKIKFSNSGRLTLIQCFNLLSICQLCFFLLQSRISYVVYKYILLILLFSGLHILNRNLLTSTSYLYSSKLILFDFAISLSFFIFFFFGGGWLIFFILCQNTKCLNTIFQPLSPHFVLSLQWNICFISTFPKFFIIS